MTEKKKKKGPHLSKYHFKTLYINKIRYTVTQWQTFINLLIYCNKLY